MPKTERVTWLGYCSNVHPAFLATDIVQNIYEVSAPIGKRFQAEPYQYGLGLWFPANAVSDLLKDDRKLENLKEALRTTGFSPFTLNAFPFGSFHESRVKEKVFYPNWGSKDRLNYTLDLMKLIQKLYLDGKEFSLSTVPLGLKQDFPGEQEIIPALGHLAEFVVQSNILEQEHGIKCHLGLEPEPGAFLETSEDVVHFFEAWAHGWIAHRVSTRLGISKSTALDEVLDRLRVCYDTCHAAVHFERPKPILMRYKEYGIRIGKFQISNAFCMRAEMLNEIGNLVHDKYFHQVVGLDGWGKKIQFQDLDQALVFWQKYKKSDMEFRVHYHVPIYLEHFGPFETTQSHITDLINELQLGAFDAGATHYEVETYTWTLLPKAYSLCEVAFGIEQELRWFARQTMRAEEGIKQVETDARKIQDSF